MACLQVSTWVIGWERKRSHKVYFWKDYLWIGFYCLLAINVIYFHKRKKVMYFLRFKKLAIKDNNNTLLILHYIYNWHRAIMKRKGQFTRAMEINLLGFKKPCGLMMAFYYVYISILSIFYLTSKNYITFISSMS